MLKKNILITTTRKKHYIHNTNKIKMIPNNHITTSQLRNAHKNTIFDFVSTRE